MKIKKIVMVLTTILSSGVAYVNAAPVIDRNSSMSGSVYNPLHETLEQKKPDAIKNDAANKQAVLPEATSKAHHQVVEQKQTSDVNSFQPTKPTQHSVSLQEDSFAVSSEAKSSTGVWTDLSNENFGKPQAAQGFNAFDQENISSAVKEEKSDLFSSAESQESLQVGVDSAGTASSQEFAVDQSEQVAEKVTDEATDKQPQLLKTEVSQAVSEQKSDDVNKIEEKSNLSSAWKSFKALLSKFIKTSMWKSSTPEQKAACKSAAQKAVAKYPELDKPVAKIESGIETLSNSQATAQAKTQAVQDVVGSIGIIENSSAANSPEVQQFATTLAPEGVSTQEILASKPLPPVVARPEGLLFDGSKKPLPPAGPRPLNLRSDGSMAKPGDADFVKPQPPVNSQQEGGRVNMQNKKPLPPASARPINLRSDGTMAKPGDVDFKIPQPPAVKVVETSHARSEQSGDKQASVKKPLPFLSQLKSAQPVGVNESVQSPDTAPAVKKSSGDQPAVKMQMSLLDGIKAGKTGLKKAVDTAPGLKSTVSRPTALTEKPMSELEKKLAARRANQASDEDNSYNASNTEVNMEDELTSQSLPSPKITPKKLGSQSSSPALSRSSSPSSSLPSSPRGADVKVESGFNTGLLDKAKKTNIDLEDADTTDDEWE